MSERIPGEVISPMIKEGIITWCEGDVFTLYVELELWSMGERVTLEEGSAVEIIFTDRSGYEVKRFSTTVDSDNCIFIFFDEETSAAFTKGRYTFDVCITNEKGEKTTVANDNVAVVV